MNATAKRIATELANHWHIIKWAGVHYHEPHCRTRYLWRMKKQFWPLPSLKSKPASNGGFFHVYVFDPSRQCRPGFFMSLEARQCWRAFACR